MAVAMNRCPILTASPPTISHFDSESGQWQGGRQQRGSYTRSLYQSPTRGGRSLAPIRRYARSSQSAAQGARVQLNKLARDRAVALLPQV